MKKPFYRPIRICPGCEQSFTPAKSNKQVHCCRECKDRYNANRRKLRDRSFVDFIAGFTNNYKILRVYEHSYSTSLSFSQLRSLKFDFDFLPNLVEENDNYYHPFGHLHLYTCMYGITSELILINIKLK
jgi:hypothetical protein